MKKNKKKETLEELNERRDALVKRYIGVWAKPASYYKKLKDIDKDIKSYEKV